MLRVTLPLRRIGNHRSRAHHHLHTHATNYSPPTTTTTTTAATSRDSSSPVRLLLVGAPGSGKGTLSKRLQRDFGLRAIASGDLLRSHIAQGTAIGQSAERDIKRGGFVSDAMMVQLISDELKKMDGHNCLLDGFPRTMVQAEKLDAFLADELKQRVSLAVHLDVSESTILSRLADRWIHPRSGRVYNTNFNPPRVPRVDDVTGEPLEKREDDQADIVCKRIRDFRNVTRPMLDYFRNQQKLVTIQGETSDEIYPILLDILETNFGWPKQQQQRSPSGMK